MKRIYFDIETERSSQEVGGWSHIEQLGVACVVTCSSHDDLPSDDLSSDNSSSANNWVFKTFLREEIPALLLELQRADLVIGFNSRGFDFRVLQPFADFDLRSLPNLDLMVDLKEVAGFRPGLGNCCEATWGEGKSSNGLESLQWWREGRRDEVINYCKHDVSLTRKLHEWGANHGHVQCRDKTTGVRTLDVKWSLDELPQAKVPEQGSLF